VTPSPVDYHDARTAKVRGVSFKDAEQAVIASVGAPNPHLVEAGHVIVHDLPLASPGEGRWRGRGDGLEHGLHFGPDLGGDLIEEVDRWHRLGLVVAGVAPKEVDQPRLGVGGAVIVHSPAHLSAPEDAGRVTVDLVEERLDVAGGLDEVVKVEFEVRSRQKSAHSRRAFV